MKSAIKRSDFLGYKAKLTFNKKGETGYKTFIGGIISIICLFFSFICSFYFLYRMFLRKDASVIHSTHINPYVNLTYSHKLPFILRLTDTNSLPFEEDERKYYITASIWQGGTNDTSLSANAKQKSVSLNIGKCDVNKHFSEEYKKYFEDFKDLNTYYCIEPRNSSQTIYGIYGNIFPFSYYSFTARYCQNTTENNNFCDPIEQIQSAFDNGLFLDFFFIDYSFNALKKKNIKELFIRKERYELSPVLFKRIWVYLENIKYIIDNGYIFSNKEIEDFHSYESVSSDFNIFERKIVISTLTVLNGMKTSIYNKQYTKFQDYLAIIGGLVKVITLFSSMLNYYNSQNSYYLKLIKDFIIDNKNINVTSKSKSNLNQLNSSIFNKSKNNISSSIDICNKKDLGLTSNQKMNSKMSFLLIKSSVVTKILPSIFMNQELKKTLLIYKEFINNRLNIINILKKLEMIQINYEVIKKGLEEMSINNNNYLLKQRNSKINNYISEIK